MRTLKNQPPIKFPNNIIAHYGTQFYIEYRDEGYTEISKDYAREKSECPFSIGRLVINKLERSYGNLKSANILKDELIGVLTWLLNNGKIEIKK